MSISPSLLPMTGQYAAEGLRLRSLHGTNGRPVRIEAVNAAGEIVDECDVAARAWFISWTASDGELVEKSFDSHNRACAAAAVLDGTH